MRKNISIIIPVFNNEKYIGRCLDSVSGKGKDVEILVIDDGSTDHTYDIIKEYKYRYNNIKYFYQKNAGVSTARNKGIDIATGKYIFFLDSDDYMSADGIEKLEKYANTNYDLIVFPYNLVKNTENKNEKIQQDERTAVIDDSNKMIKSALIGDTVVRDFKKQDMRSSCSKLIKLDIIKKNKIKYDKQIIIAEDMIFMLYVYSCVKGTLFVNTSVYFYFQNNSSAINSYHSNYIQNIKNVDNCIETFLNEKHYNFNEVFNFYKLKDIILYLKYDIFNVKNTNSRVKKYKKINNFLNEFNYNQLFHEVKHSSLYKKISIKQKIVYQITIHRLFFIDEILFYLMYK